MGMINSLDNLRLFNQFFDKEPNFDFVRVQEVQLQQDAARMVMKIELSYTPDKIPDKWRTNKYNRTLLSLMFIECQQLSVNGWSHDNMLNIDIHRDGNHVCINATGPATSISGRFSFLELISINGYLASPDCA